MLSNLKVYLLCRYICIWFQGTTGILLDYLENSNPSDLKSPSHQMWMSRNRRILPLILFSQGITKLGLWSVLAIMYMAKESQEAMYSTSQIEISRFWLHLCGLPITCCGLPDCGNQRNIYGTGHILEKANNMDGHGLSLDSMFKTYLQLVGKKAARKSAIEATHRPGCSPVLDLHNFWL